MNSPGSIRWSTSFGYFKARGVPRIIGWEMPSTNPNGSLGFVGRVGDWQGSEFYDAYINAAFLRPGALGCDTLEKLLLTFVVQQKQRVGGLVGGSSPTPIVRCVLLDVAE